MGQHDEYRDGADCTSSESVDISLLSYVRGFTATGSVLHTEVPVPPRLQRSIDRGHLKVMSFGADGPCTRRTNAILLTEEGLELTGKALHPDA